MATCGLPQTTRPAPQPRSPKVPEVFPGASQTAYGRYGALGDEVPEEDVRWDMEGPNGDPMEDFRITPPRGAINRSRRHARRRSTLKAYAEQSC